MSWQVNVMGLDLQQSRKIYHDILDEIKFTWESLCKYNIMV